MSKEKQIEEMAHIISETQAKDMCKQIEHCGKGCPHYELYYEVCKDGFCAEALYNAGYRKQSEGEWVKTQFVARSGFYTIKEFPCNQCGEKFEVAKGNEHMHFCPNCGAKMKGGE